MQKKVLLLLFLFLSFFSFSQNAIRFKGKIIDENTQLPVEFATVYLSSAKDSTLIDYTITNKKGDFDLNVKKNSEIVFLKVSMVGYQDFKQELSEVSESRDFGAIHIIEAPESLDEVIIKVEAPPIRIKADTLEFNAASFKVRPDSNVETLLKQLPGVEIETDGKITVNGKEVNQILVNGKPFFDKDGKIALQSLPSEIIKKVQVTDTKSKKEEISGRKASSDNASINLTIDEEKNKGFFGKFMGGYGTDDRYESSVLVNYFKGNRKISVLGSSNNINASGFSMNEVFDNMGGGRNRAMALGGGNSGGKGVRQSNMIGVNYADTFFKGFDANGNYFYNNSSLKNTNTTRSQDFLPNGTFISESEGTSKEDRFSHSSTFTIEYKIDSTTTVFITPRFTKENIKGTSQSTGFTLGNENQLLNNSENTLHSESDNSNFGNTINFYKVLGEKGRYINTVFSNSNSKTTSNELNRSVTNFYDDSVNLVRVDKRDQIQYNRGSNDNISVELEYMEPVTDSVNLKVGVDYNWTKISDHKNVFNFDESTQLYSVQNDTLSNFLQSEMITITPKAGVVLEKKNLYFGVNLGTSITRFTNESLYLQQNTHLVKDYVLPSADLYLNYKFTKSKSIGLNYAYKVGFPSANQILPVEDLSNPLVSYIGNPELSPNKSHYLTISYRNYNYATRSGYSFYTGGQYYDSQVISSTVYDESAKRIITYKNISGIFTTSTGANWSKSVKKEAHTFRGGIGVRANLSMNKGYINAEMYDAFNFQMRTKVNFSWDYGELLSISPSYAFLYNNTNYTNYSVNSASNYQHQINLQTTNYWPKNWVFGNDFGYTYNSAISDGFKKDFYLWNTSLGYNFLKDQMLFKIKVYDVLNQNQSAVRSITATSVRDEENTVLKRYAMFSLTYKIGKFTGKEKKGRNRR